MVASIITKMDGRVTRLRVLSLAWPLIVANTTSPLLGLVDTFVLGHGHSSVELAAVALGSLIFSFAYWGFGFLRMTTTGFVAQALAEGDHRGVQGAMLRPLLIGGVVGLVFFTLQGGVASLSFALLNAGSQEEEVARAYFQARIFGAPVALASLSATGVLIAQRRTGVLLMIQAVTNGLNIVLDVVFVQVFDWGAPGVGFGTAIAEWVHAALSVGIVWRSLKIRLNRETWAQVFDRSKLKEAFQANRDVMIRTLAMIFAFSFFTQQGASLGAATLAANHILLQFVAFSAFFLDGFAHVTESFVGEAKGTRDRVAFDGAVRRTSEVALLCAVFLSGGLWCFGDDAVRVLTSLPEVRREAEQQLVAMVAYVGVSVVAFQLDGIFIGTSATGALRNAALVSAGGFLGLAQVLVPTAQNAGLWWSFVLYVGLRGLSLAILFFPLRRRLFPDDSVAPLS